MIYDVVMYNGELDLLKARVQYLDPVVDRFVVLESAYTFSGKPKPLYGQEAMAVSDKVGVVRAELQPGAAPFTNEKRQRDAINIVLEVLKPDDIVLLSDVDEIPATGVLEDMIATGLKRPIVFMQQFYYYYLNCQVMKPTPWYGTMAMRVKDMSGHQHMRSRRAGLMQVSGGWHYSYTYAPDIIAEKLGSFSHTEYDTPKWRDASRLATCAAWGLDPFERPEYVLQFGQYDGEIKPWPSSVAIRPGCGTVNRADVDAATHIQGWMWPGELEWLSDIASQCDVVIEVGSANGRSTTALSSARDIVCVDSQFGSDFDTNVAPFAHKITKFRLDSKAAAEYMYLYELKADCVFIDAAHDYEHVLADIEAYIPLVRRGGIICGHDAGHDGVHMALQKILPDKKIGSETIWWRPM